MAATREEIRRLYGIRNKMLTNIEDRSQETEYRLL
jgi:hypothetical protein